MAITVDCDYPGGNIIVLAVDGDTINVRQDLRDTTEWWFYYNFRVRGAAGRKLEIVFDDSGPGPIAACGPAVSTDSRQSWHWDVTDFDTKRFSYQVPPQADEVYFALSMPYQLEDFGRYLDRHAANPLLTRSKLTTTEAGREAPLLTLGNPQNARRNILFTCRHHACESVASYVLEGLLDHLLSDEAADFRHDTAISAIPFVDLDGVEAGDQGKSRHPHDHNRDYGGNPLYATVRATKELARQLSSNNLAFFADLHCPWVRNGDNEAVFLVGPPAPGDAAVERFADFLRRADTGPIPYTGRADVPFGTSWNKAPAGGLVTSRGFMADVAVKTLIAGFTLEFTYALAERDFITAERARLFGRGFAAAMISFLKTED